MNQQQLEQQQQQRQRQDRNLKNFQQLKLVVDERWKEENNKFWNNIFSKIMINYEFDRRLR